MSDDQRWTGTDHRGRYRVDADSIERESWGGYRSVSDPLSYSNYETLVGPDGTEVATLGEPEDRTFSRNLSPLIDRLAVTERALARAEAREREAVARLYDATVEWIANRYGPSNAEDFIHNGPQAGRVLSDAAPTGTGVDDQSD